MQHTKSLLCSALIASAAFALPSMASAQVAGGTVIGVTQEITTAVAKGWSAKKHLLGQTVYSATTDGDSVGTLVDIIVSPAGSVSYAVVNASRFLGLSSHYVLVPVEQFAIQEGRIALPGASRAALRNVPKFEYVE